MLSVVIPTWSGTDELADMAIALCHQVRPMCDELIVTEDGDYYRGLEGAADKYLIHQRLGHARNLALGIQSASCEFVALIDSDMEIMDGDLRDLCISGHVVSPASVQKRFDEIAGWFVVCPKSFLDELLPYDHASLALSEGIDIWVREFDSIHKSHFVSSDKLVVHHRDDQSYGRLFKRLREEAVQISHLNREIMPDRHLVRMMEDPLYAAKWAI